MWPYRGKINAEFPRKLSYTSDRSTLTLGRSSPPHLLGTSPLLKLYGRIWCTAMIALSYFRKRFWLKNKSVPDDLVKHYASFLFLSPHDDSLLFAFPVASCRRVIPGRYRPPPRCADGRYKILNYFRVTPQNRSMFPRNTTK